MENIDLNSNKSYLTDEDIVYLWLVLMIVTPGQGPYDRYFTFSEVVIDELSAKINWSSLKCKAC